jgi:dienelactone hydrolase
LATAENRAGRAFIAGIRARATAGDAVGAQIARYTVALAARAVPEWQATLDALGREGLDGTGREGLDGPVGYWGVSLGGAIGVLLVAAEPRIRAAVLGLVGHGSLAEAAGRIHVPVEFLLQWDDELVPREEGLAMFGGWDRGRRRCTLTRAGTRRYPRSSWNLPSVFWYGICVHLP